MLEEAPPPSRRAAAGLASAVTSLLLTMASPAHGITYRCELPPSQAGHPAEVRYQSQVCEGGRTLRNTDHRTDAQRADIAKATKANALLARQLERERRRHEKQGTGQRPIAMDDRAPPDKPKDSSIQGQTLKPARPFTARTPKTTPASSQKPPSN